MREWIGENRLAMLNLRDRAEREGWLNSARYANELRKLINPELNLREQFGDDMYDRFLYATGKSNRVIAAEVYPDSAAVASGILAGDVVRSYASTTIYSMNDLKQATLEGEAGESVLVVLERDGMVFSITVPRGPLGIEMRMESHEPE
jgi:S1-C subfamily serine protease